MIRKTLLFLFGMITFIGHAQVYHNLTINNGLKNRRIYQIQKDKTGYMWFLALDGISRYNGKDFKSYVLTDEGKEVTNQPGKNWIYTDSNGDLWEMGCKGRIYRYDSDADRFKLTYKLRNPLQDEIVFYGYIDKDNTIWLCGKDSICLYHPENKTTRKITNGLKEKITSIAQVNDAQFFVGTEHGIYETRLQDNVLSPTANSTLKQLHTRISELYFERHSQKLFIGTFQQGMYIYDTRHDKLQRPDSSLTDCNITHITALNGQELLVSTDGAGVFKIDTRTNRITPYSITDYERTNSMSGNNIIDIYVGDDQRIWMANYPIGITIRDNRYPGYKWYLHYTGNLQSLSNNQVNCIIEDSEGDLWFGTNNGISLYNPATGRWKSFLSSFDTSLRIRNSVFITLCEAEPGVIWAGGYNSGLYRIHKHTGKVSYFTPNIFSNSNIPADKYIRDIKKDSEGYIWAGGYSNLKRIDLKNKEIRLYRPISSVTAITERNQKEMWIGTTNGLFLVDKASGKTTPVRLPIGAATIHTLYQGADDTLYIGTNGFGLLLYSPAQKSFTRYYADNCALISNNIYSIVPKDKDHLVLSTENSLSFFNIADKTFQNWTQEQGLYTTHFNPISGIIRQNGNLVFGSSQGAIEFPSDIKLPHSCESKMVFSDFKVFYQTVYPGEEGSPLEKSINDTRTLNLKYSQNIFSLKVSSINYDYPSNILYAWKLEGFYDQWSKPSTENTIQFTNLSPGRYTLYVRAISREDNRLVLEERQMNIVVAQPWWFSAWAWAGYLLLACFIIYIAWRFITIKSRQKESDEKIQFFINTAHDIRTPLTLVKVPLEEMQKEDLPEQAARNVEIALQNVDALLRQTTNLINFERANVYTSGLKLSEEELNGFITEVAETFEPTAHSKHIAYSHVCNFPPVNVWFDKEKMESILKNLLSNAFKYTPENGQVSLLCNVNEHGWHIEIQDTGIGIPASEQKKIFKLHFRGSNAINQKITGSGIGLMLVSKLVKLHKGKIALKSVEGKGSTVILDFPKDIRRKVEHEVLEASSKANIRKETEAKANATASATVSTTGKQAKILIVEDNDDLRAYLQQSFAGKYTVQTATNGKSGLDATRLFKPDLIISDRMMPEMSGDELCDILKGDIETSHIPIILLTALNTEKDIIAGLNKGADDYIVKPFNIGILKATVENLLKNRALLRQKYADMDKSAGEENECLNCSSDLDWKFITQVIQHVKNNMSDNTLSVEKLCGLLNMSRTSFYNKLKVLTDQSPADYVRSIRLSEAARMLILKEHNITEIAELTGFSDAKYFREVFKKHYGMSPRQYQQKEKEKEKEKEEKENN